MTHRYSDWLKPDSTPRQRALFINLDKHSDGLTWMEKVVANAADVQLPEPPTTTNSKPNKQGRWQWLAEAGFEPWDYLASLIRQHRLDGTICDCGWEHGGQVVPGVRVQHSEHVRDKIKEMRMPLAPAPAPVDQHPLIPHITAESAAAEGMDVRECKRCKRAVMVDGDFVTHISAMGDLIRGCRAASNDGRTKDMALKAGWSATIS